MLSSCIGACRKQATLNVILKKWLQSRRSVGPRNVDAGERASKGLPGLAGMMGYLRRRTGQVEGVNMSMQFRLRAYKCLQGY